MKKQPLLAYLVLPQVNLPQSVPVEMEKKTILKNISGVFRAALSPDTLSNAVF